MGHHKHRRSSGLLRNSFGVLKIGQFRYQLAAQVTSEFGSAISPVALSLGVLHLTGSVRDVGILLAARTAPTVIFLLIGGVVADRLPRQRVMVVCNLVCAVAQLIVGAMLITKTFHLELATVAQFATGTALAFYFPSVNGLTAQTVPLEHRQQANGLLSLSRSVSMSIGPLLASLLVVGDLAGLALLIDGLTFLASAYLLTRLKNLAGNMSDVAQMGFFKELREGFSEVVSRTWVWSGITSFMVGNLAVALITVLGPAMTIEHGRGPAAWGGVISAMSIGMIIGDLLSVRFSARRPLVISKFVEMSQACLPAAIALNAPTPLIIAAAVLFGSAVSFPESLWNTALQANLKQNVLSRVSSYDWLGSIALRPVCYLFAVALLDELGGRNTFVLLAVVVVAIRVGCVFLSKIPAPGRGALPRVDDRAPERVVR
ncbi:MFS transporter [Micromonospora sp. NPDC005172]|uniref:MFS transporter n=1 Tax=Micromonospora sp. NPDC005172 TaxID=3156867 RepID=UPI0033B13B58